MTQRLARRGFGAKIELIVAVSENGVIGDGARIPWHLPDDQQFFKRTTMGHAMMMGRTTWETFPRPLPKRTSVVLTRNLDYEAEGAYVAHDFDTGLEIAATHPPEGGHDRGLVFIIGGAALYAEALPRASVAYVTRVHAEFEGDVRFEAFCGEPPQGWVLDESERHEVDERHAHAFTIETWHRR